ncbi:NADP-dependent oxidoreductase [Rhodococcus opacus]|uniref:Putative oxidoreductase n=1 Tax=Rhodococcus opacus (strain B4) TaxID=632772 RepID=C1B6T6_RHOOB|nr:NADP-dependent oxidoreductase [Rhodococcus opacus]BAH51389.1 putative oxidoreductase [Rhodococcus opacus B4]
MEEMKAVRLHAYGGPENLVYEDAPRPEPAEDELVVRVHAAGVNVLDWLLGAGGFEHFPDVPLPWIPGWDISGVVEVVGNGVSGFQQGDSVYGMVRLPEPGNAYAEYTAVPASQVVAKPPILDHIQAAAVPMTGLTAWRALVDEAGLQPGQRVLIHAASGGVGHLAVQFAKALGAHVVATASGSNREYVNSLGADEFVDYREQRFETSVAPVHAVIDTVGGKVQQRSLDVLKRDGVLVALPTEVPDEVKADAERRGIRTRYFSVEPNADTLTKISRLVDDGRVRPTVSSVYPLAEAQAAQEEGRAGHVRGKLVLDVTTVAS